MYFAQPNMLFLLIFPLVVGYLLWRKRGALNPRMRFSSLLFLDKADLGPRAHFKFLPLVLLLGAGSLMIVAMARPQSPLHDSRRYSEGIDIMLVIDVSGSMQALDFTPNRLEKAKEVVRQFVGDRVDDQIGVVIFGQDAFYLCPLTQDYPALDWFIERIDFDLIDGNQTAIGMGLATAVARLKDSKGKSKVAILLTDGENNAGRIDPLSAAEVAKEFGVRVYTIGVGSEKGEVRVPQQTVFGPSIGRRHFRLDVETLTKIAEMTGGQFFRATNDQSLERIYSQINQMERTKVESTQTRNYEEVAHRFLIPAVVLMLMALALDLTVFRTFP